MYNSTGLYAQKFDHGLILMLINLDYFQMRQLMLALISIIHAQTILIRVFPHNLSSTGMNVEKRTS